MDIQLGLRDKTLLLAGPLGTLTQHLTMALHQEGANIAFVNEDFEGSERFSDQLMGLREGNSKLGRSAAIKVDFSEASSIKEAVSRTAEVFGRMDGLLDATGVHKAAVLSQTQSSDELDQLFQKNLRSSLLLAQEVLPFLTHRGRGRLLFLLHELAWMEGGAQNYPAVFRSALRSYVQGMAREHKGSGITFNALELGPSEEYLQAQEGASIQENLLHLQKSFPQVQLLESEKFTQAVLYLLSPMGGALNGQSLRVT